MTDFTDFASSLRGAFARRARLIERLAAEDTDCLRLFHGSQEGVPGVTIDRYGDLALMQSFHRPLPDSACAIAARSIEKALPGLEFVYNDRSGRGSRVRNRLSGTQRTAAETEHIATEHSVRFSIQARHRGNDPWLFLDLRTTRRAIMSEAAGKSLLNLFAYTCGAGVAAAAAGARRVLNVDFAKSSLAVGTANARRNEVSHRTVELASDVFPAMRQLAGLRQPTVDRGRRLPSFPRLEPQQFDLVLLDPPRLAKSRFGVVDVTRDYQALLVPSLGALADGGALYCTNHVAQVDEREWHAMLRRCAAKHGRVVRSLDVLPPGEDFPSSDHRPPLKAVRLGL